MCQEESSTHQNFGLPLLPRFSRAALFEKLPVDTVSRTRRCNAGLSRMGQFGQIACGRANGWPS